MSRRTASGRRQVVFSVLLGIVSLLTWCTGVWATTQLGNVELQAWYRQRNTFQTDGGEHVSWAQWRNEFFAWMVYENLVEQGKLFNQIEVPLVESAALNARYRFRADPVFSVRDHFEKLYEREERESFIFPENGFRDLFLDMDFGQVGPGSLSMRVGNQQIVWGESDLFRSLDVINPLRIDQNQAVGEKFDEFRSPILAFKALYTIGNIGQYFSDVAIEPFYSPRWRSGASDLLLEGVFRLPHNIKGCLDNNDRLIEYDVVRCSERRADGTRQFIQRRPGWLGSRRMQHPYSIFTRGPNPRAGTPDFLCLDSVICSPDVFGHRASFIADIRKGNDERALNGINGMTQSAGVRVLGKTWFNVDFSLNYIFQPTGPNGVFDINEILSGPGGPPAPFRSDIFYGDPDVAMATFGLPPEALSGNFQEGLRRCLSDGGKTGEGGSNATILFGADLLGYNQPDRFGPKGALDANGNARPGKHQAARPPFTFCLPGVQEYSWTHVAGFTGTYNDFDYTGAIFRFEQSYTTKEPIRAYPPLFGRRRNDPATARLVSDDFDKYTGVWRSMVGFDLFRSLPFFRYVPGISPGFYTQAWFISGQWLMENYWNNVANNFCSNVDNIGGVTSGAVDTFEAANPGLRAYPNRQCRRYRWNHLLTLVLANNGLFGSKLETRNAVAFEPRDEQLLFYTQNWWRGLFGIPNLEASFGIAWYAGSSLGDSWSSLQHFADRDQIWFEFTYYLL